MANCGQTAPFILPSLPLCRLYHPSAHHVAKALVSLPFAAINVVLFCGTAYGMAGLRMDRDGAPVVQVHGLDHFCLFEALSISLLSKSQLSLARHSSYGYNDDLMANSLKKTQSTLDSVCVVGNLGWVKEGWLPSKRPILVVLTHKKPSSIAAHAGGACSVSDRTAGEHACADQFLLLPLSVLSSRNPLRW